MITNCYSPILRARCHHPVPALPHRRLLRGREVQHLVHTDTGLNPIAAEADQRQRKRLLLLLDLRPDSLKTGAGLEMGDSISWSEFIIYSQQVSNN